jgi:hypothetical protein
MKWTPGHQSNDVEDRRAQGPAGAGLGGGAIPLLFFLFRRFGVVGVLVAAQRCSSSAALGNPAI